MGILKSKKPSNAPVPAVKRQSTDFANLKPLKPGGARGFTGVRERKSPHDQNGKLSADDMMDSDADDEDDAKRTVVDKDDADDGKDEKLSPEEAKRRGELADGVQKIRVSGLPSPFKQPSQAAFGD